MTKKPQESFRILAACLITVCLIFVQETKAEEPKRFHFPSTGVTFDAEFEGARMNDCILESDGEYQIVIRAENEPINNSAWYAFRIVAETPQTLVVRLTYEGGSHRYHPKIRTDGTVWRRLQDDHLQSDGESIVLRINVGPEPLFVSAQELLGLVQFNEWMAELSELSFIDKAEIGRSVENRPIHQLNIS